MDTIKPIVVEQSFDVSPQRLWRAVTDIGQMRLWYFEMIPDFQAVVGFETQFDVACGGRHFLHQWTVTEVIPQQRIVYRWRYEGYAGDSYVAFAINEEGGSTTLTLSHQTIEPFPGDIPEFAPESCRAGWTYFIKERLVEYLA